MAPPHIGFRRVHVVADTREGRSGIITRLRADERLEVEVRPLEVGDYWIDHDLAVERKSLRDFYRSIFDGKIFVQLGQLRRASARCLLLVEGLYRSPAFARAPSWLTGALLTMCAGFQVPLLPTRNRTHTAETLYLLALHQARETRGTPRFSTQRSRTAIDRWLRHRVLQGVPLVGPKRASSLLDAFETLGPIFSASPDALERIEGIGPETAAMIARLGMG